ncbi:MAG: crossover junction endodeoxyribonuclease RuvC [Treponema sp.]|nr:crossover junction endodeoxyribonuclease RuvC [Treponema sp.]
MTFKTYIQIVNSLKISNRNNKTRRVLGIDPGLAHTGWGIIDSDGIKYKYIAHGVIETTACTPHGKRLLYIFTQLYEIISQYAPDEASMEKLYFVNNVTSALSVAEARGIIILCLEQNNIPLAEYAPTNIKRSVCGTGKADKIIVQNCLKMLLGLKQIPEPNHAADALAASITHINSSII